MDSAHEKLLEAFEDFEADLEVEEILKKVKAELAVLDNDVTEFGEKLKEREQLKRAAQATRAARATYFHQHWNPGCYPQFTTCEWYIQGLDFCCPYWRYEFKRPDTSASTATLARCPARAIAPAAAAPDKCQRSATDPKTTTTLNDYDVKRDN